MDKQTLMELVKEGREVNENYQTEMSDLEKAGELEKLGFKDVSKKMLSKIEMKYKLAKITEFKYIKITTKQIEDYLKRKASRYNEERNKKIAKQKKELENSLLNETNHFAQSLLYAFGIDRANMNSESRGTATGYLSNFYSDIPSEEKNDNPEVSYYDERTEDYLSSSKNTIGRFIFTETKLSGYSSIPPTYVLKILEEHQNRNIFDYFTIAKVNSIVDPLLFGRINDCEDRFFICQWGDDIQLDDII